MSRDRMQESKLSKKCGHHCVAKRASDAVRNTPLIVGHCGCPECHNETGRNTVVYCE